jgi:MHS family alpha-ketoglutarate permease-like MFS transporter
MSGYGWRIPFLIGAVAAAGVLVLRRGLHETAEGGERHVDAGSLTALFRQNGRAFATVVALTAGGSLAFYTFTTYMQKYLVLTVGLSKETATALMTGVLIVFMALQPLMGLLSDRIGRRNNIILFAGLASLFTVPILSVLAETGSTTVAFLLVLAGLTINSFYTSVGGLFKAEMFPIHLRALGVGLSYGVGNALFGGTAENIALFFKQAGYESGFYWYVTAICVVSLLAALTLKDTREDNILDNVRV